MLTLNQALLNTHVQTMLLAARQYCQFIEAFEPASEIDFMLQAERLLHALYMAGREMPEVELLHNVDIEAAITHEEKTAVYNNIGKRSALGYYHVLLNPLEIEADAETATGDFTDDLLDIYTDLKTVLLLFDKATPAALERSLWLCRFKYRHHWGQHCADALHAVFYYLQQHRHESNVL